MCFMQYHILLIRIISTDLQIDKIDNSQGLRKATLTFSSSDDVKTEHLCSAVMTLKAIFM